MLAIAESLEKVGSIQPALSSRYDDEDYAADEYDKKFEKIVKSSERLQKNMVLLGE